MCFSANGRTARKSRSACWDPREPIACARPCPADDTWDNKLWSWFSRGTFLWLKPDRRSEHGCRRWSGPRVRLFIKSQTGLNWAQPPPVRDRKSIRLNSSHTVISYAVFCLKKKKNIKRHNKFMKKEQP